LYGQNECAILPFTVAGKKCYSKKEIPDVNTIRDTGTLYSGERQIAEVTYTIHDTRTPGAFGELYGTFRITGEQPHPIHAPSVNTPFPVLHLEDGRTLRIIITQGARPFSNDAYQFQGQGDFDS